MDMFMQVYHIQDYDREDRGKVTWMLERSVLDAYYFVIEKFGYQQTEQDIEDMNHMLKIYFNLLTDNGSRPLVLVDIWNLDRDWIAKNISEEHTRSNCWSKVDEYLKDQENYKEWIYSKLKELDIRFTTLDLVIRKVSKDFTPDYRRTWIKENIVCK